MAVTKTGLEAGRQRLRLPGNSPPRDPSLGLWILAAISLVLPFIGGPLAVWGAVAVAKGWSFGWPAVGLGIGLLILDVVIDFVWAAHLTGRTDDPTLNRGGELLIGRSAIVATAIENGRGRVRIGDSEWIAEGGACPAGSTVVVVGVTGTVLKVTADGPAFSPATP